MERSESLHFIQCVNSMARSQSRDRLVSEKEEKEKLTKALGARVRVRRNKDKAKAAKKKQADTDAKRVHALKTHAWTRDMLKAQARRNGFDLDKFSYKPDLSLVRAQSDFDVTRLWGAKSTKGSASPGISPSGLPVTTLKHIMELKRSKSTLINMNGSIIPESERMVPEWERER